MIIWAKVAFFSFSFRLFQVLYKFKTAKFFEKPKNITHSSDNNIEFPFAIQIIYLCSESRRLCVAGSMGQVMLFKFRKVESHSSIFVLEIPIFSDYFDDIYGTSPEFDFTPHQVQKSESSDSDKVQIYLIIYIYIFLFIHIYNILEIWK